ARKRIVYGSDHREAETLLLDEDGNPIMSSEGYAGWTSEYDDRGELSARRSFGLDRQPVITNDGTAGWHSTFDPSGNETSHVFLGLDGKPILSKEDIAGWKSEFDERGNEIQREFIDVDDTPRRLNGENIGWKARYDQARLLDYTYYGYSGAEGYANRKDTYNEDGLVIRVMYLDANDMPTLDKNGVNGWKNLYSPTGQWIDMTYVGLDGEPTRHPDGYATNRSAYDDNGNEKRREYLGEHGQLAANLSEGGIAGWNSTFDPNGNEVSREFFGIDGNPTHYDGENQGWQAEYIHNRLSWQTYYGFPDVISFRKKKVQYNESGSVLAVYLLDNDDHLTLDADGVAGWRNDYDPRGFLTEQVYFGVDEQLKNHQHGYAGLRDEFDNNGNWVNRTYFDEQRQQVATRLVIGFIQPQSQAEQKGLRVGDILMSYGGTQIHSLRHMQQWTTPQANDEDMNDESDTVPLTVLRDGKEVHIELHTGLIGLSGTDQVVPGSVP
ncbi:MAG: PDZ domain-containing protein, partial [Planctomycetales bacterium]|nr:PDZ domain-containing protein [Planctomycetales bacterium]